MARIDNQSRLWRSVWLGWLLVAGLSAACGDGAQGPATCRVKYRGNFAASEASDAVCAHLVASDDAHPDDLSLRVELTSAEPDGIDFEAQIYLGAHPQPGRLSSRSVGARWSALGKRGESGCAYSAGDQSVPTGSYTLKLTDVDAKGAAHGTLHVEQSLHAPLGVDCGPDDAETVDVAF